MRTVSSMVTCQPSPIIEDSTGWMPWKLDTPLPPMQQKRRKRQKRTFARTVRDIGELNAPRQDTQRADIFTSRDRTSGSLPDILPMPICPIPLPGFHRRPYSLVPTATPQSGRSLEGGDKASADGHNKYGVRYISSVARSTNPARVSIYVPGGRFYHTADGGKSFFVGP